MRSSSKDSKEVKIKHTQFFPFENLGHENKMSEKKMSIHEINSRQVDNPEEKINY